MKSSTKLAWVLGISICFFMTEIALGFKTKSIALIADAFHYLIISYALAYAAARLQAEGKRSPAFSYAFHRAELCGAAFNAVFLLALALSIFLQSIERFVNISPVDHPLYVLVVGGVGLVLNILSALLVHDHHGHGDHTFPPETGEASDYPLGVLAPQGGASVSPHTLHGHVNLDHTPKLSENLGILAVLIHLLGDAINNVGVMLSGVIIWKLHSPSRYYADPAVSLAISIMIFSSAVPLTIKTARILLEASPVDLDIQSLTKDILSVTNVISIHDLHIWQLSQSIQMATVHVKVLEETTFAQWEVVEETMQECFACWGVSHVTIAPEIERTNGDVRGSTVLCGDRFDCSLEDNGAQKMRRRNAGNGASGATE